MATKIVYEDKVALSTKPNTADKNKITASDMNAIKTSVNELIDESKDNNIFKNLYNVGNAKLSGASITLTNTNNQITLDGTMGYNSEVNIYLDSPSTNKDKEGIILGPGTYSATIKKVSGSLSIPISFYLRKSDGTSIYNGSSVFTTDIPARISDGTMYYTTFTLTEETRMHWTGYRSTDEGHTLRLDNLVLQFQIEEGDSGTSYTPWRGYIVESGSNSNGSWIKYSDGTMICSAKKELSDIAISNSVNNGALFASDVLTSFGNFPVSFVDKPIFFTMDVGSSGGYGAWTQKMSLPSATNINSFRIIGTWSSTQSFEVSYMAIGRWK